MANSSDKRIVTGYHGCDASVAGTVLSGAARLNFSTNPYDWLGRGIYFWEHGPQRAAEWAVEQARFRGMRITEPAVLGARIDLGECFDLLDTANTRVLGKWYREFKQRTRERGALMPENRDASGHRRGDRVLRFLDRAIIDYAINRIAEDTGIVYQTVRGVFVEGKPAFPRSKIALKSHIQIAVRDPACILEFFKPASVANPRE
ncbi:MAG: hypothetical protein C5B50_16775 [Verrucomicrobia bacterium]|nr:MAG: hypothetical protein C5B50_16775 [Verrucomicrobiota bacterium]